MIKYPYDNQKSNFIPARDAISLWSMEQDKSDQDKFYADESPELFYLRLRSNKFVCNTKIVDLLSRGE